MNYRGRSVKLVQTNTDAVSPVLVSTRGLGALLGQLLEDAVRGRCRGRVAVVRGGRQRRLLPLLRTELRRRHRRLPQPDGAGAAVRSLGLRLLAEQGALPHAGRDLSVSPRSTASAGIPIDGIVQDWNYWGDGSRWSGMVFDPERYPGPGRDGEAPPRSELPPDDLDLAGLGPDTAIHKEMDAKGFLYPARGLGRLQVLRRLQSRRPTTSTGSTSSRALDPRASTPCGSTPPSPT